MKKTNVALLAEGVDRNQTWSKSPRRSSVALLAEGVDRNDNDVDKFIASFGRPPRGGRG